MKALLAFAIALSLALNAFLAFRLWSASSSTQTTSSTGEMVVMRTPGGLLEVSRITTEERFDSTTSHTVLGVPIGKTIAQIRVPAVYRYHVPLAKDWSIRLTGNTLVAIAPPVQASLPVAIDTGKLESFSSGVWSPMTGSGAIEALQRSITARLGEKAQSDQLLLLQREAARQTVHEFLSKRIGENSRWRAGKPPTLFVFFEDEPLGRRAAPLLSQLP